LFCLPHSFFATDATKSLMNLPKVHALHDHRCVPTVVFVALPPSCALRCHRRVRVTAVCMQQLTFFLLQSFERSFYVMQSAALLHIQMHFWQVCFYTSCLFFQS
jgi:hypothetical protein